MENHPREAIDTVLNCAIPYIQNGDDRNSVSSVCRNWYELEGMTRKHVTVHVFYSPTPSRLHQRFPSIESLTLKGLPDWFQKKKLSIDINQWIQEIAVTFRCLKSLHICNMDVHDSDLELLARTRGRELRVLKIRKCKGFSTDGLLHIGKYCNDLRTLCLKGIEFNNKDGKWLHELALQNTGIESLDFRYFIHDVKDLTLLAKNCSQSLVSLKIAGFDLVNLVDIFRYAVRLEDCFVSSLVEDQMHTGFKLPTSIRYLGIYYLTNNSFPFLLPFAHQLRELDLIHGHLDANSQCLLFQNCPNLEVLYTRYVHGDLTLQVIGEFCKKLRKFKADDSVTQIELMSMVKGCLELECLDIGLADISNEFLECIGTHLKNLRGCHMTSCGYRKTSLPLDDGIRAMLIGCSKLERLSIRLQPEHRGFTDVSLASIGKYGHNLRYLSLGYLGESASVGLVCLSKGCPKLRKLEIQSYPFSKETLAPIVYDMHMLRYMLVRDVNDNIVFAITRPKFQS